MDTYDLSKIDKDIKIISGQGSGVPSKESIKLCLTDPEGKFSHPEKDAIAQRIVEMFEKDEVRTYFKVGSHDVCLERPNSSSINVTAHKMNSTLEQNEYLVNRFNKRK